MEDSLGKEIGDRLLSHSRATREFMLDLEINDEMVRCVPPVRPRKSEGEDRAIRGQTFIAEFYRCMETNRTAVESLLFSDEPWFNVSPVRLGDDLAEKAENTQGLMEKQASGNAHNLPLQSKMSPALMSFLVNGTAVAYVSWDSTERMVSQGANWVPRVLHDGPGFRHVPLTQFHFTPGATCIAEAPWVAERGPQSVKRIKELMAAAAKVPGAKVRPPEMIDEFSLDRAPAPYTEGETVERKLMLSRGYVNVDSLKRPIVVDYFGEHPDIKDSPVDWRIVTVNGQWIIQMPTPFSHGLKPYIDARLLNMDGSFYGLGFGKINQLPQKEINEYMDLLMNQLGVSVYNAWQTDMGTMGDKKSFKMKPGKIYPTAKYGKLTPLFQNLQGIGPTMELIQKRVDDMRGTCAATGVQQGIPTDVSAREVSAMGNASDRRMMNIAGVWRDKMVIPVLWMWHELNKQFHTDKEMVSVPGMDGATSNRMVQGVRQIADPMTGQITWESDLLDDIDMKINTAMDFDGKKGMMRRMTTALDSIMQMANTPIAPTLGIDFGTAMRLLLRETLRLAGVRPGNLFAPKAPPQAVPGAPAPVPGAVTPPPGPELPPAMVSEGLTPVPEQLPPGASGGVMPS